MTITSQRMTTEIPMTKPEERRLTAILWPFELLSLIHHSSLEIRHFHDPSLDTDANVAEESILSF
jgi:hypothetical protein